MTSLNSHSVAISDEVINAGIARGRALRSAAFQEAGAALVRLILGGLRRGVGAPMIFAKEDCKA